MITIFTVIFQKMRQKPGRTFCFASTTQTVSKLLAISGQQNLTINRSADTVEVSSKDTKGGWKKQIPGMKEWSIDNDGIYILNAESHKLLGQYFENGDMVCLKVIDAKEKKPLFGGLACITDYSLEAPYDDSMTYSLSFSGNGALTDLTSLSTEDAAKVTDMPEDLTTE